MELSPQQKRALLAPVRCFLLDMDGTFYLGNQLLEGSLDFLSALDATGRTACFLTNNSSKSARVYDEKLARMGVPERYRRVITSGHAAAHYCLKTFPGKSAWVQGNDMLKEELCAMGLRISEEAPDYVLIVYGYCNGRELWHDQYFGALRRNHPKHAGCIGNSPVGRIWTAKRYDPLPVKFLLSR